MHRKRFLDSAIMRAPPCKAPNVSPKKPSLAFYILFFKLSASRLSYLTVTRFPPEIFSRRIWQYQHFLSRSGLSVDLSAFPTLPLTWLAVVIKT
jgi:hypothetical protein